MPDVPEVRSNHDANRFEITTASGIAVLKFERTGDILDLQHTSVPEKVKGTGYGSALARAALEHARQNHLKVVPTCAFVRTFMQRHKEYDDLRVR